MDNFTNLSDQEVVSLCLARFGKDERPFAEIFQRHHIFVERVLFRYFSREEDIEDLSQEVFFKVYRGLKQFEGRSSLKTWLFRIAINTAKNELRKRSRRPTVIESPLQEMEEILSSGNKTEIQAALHKNERLQYAFAQLKDHEKEILLLKHAEKMTYEEISSRLNLSLSASKMRAQRARLAMKIKYQENDHER
jgi:RNA polymerase sigma-70 factor, ECF subfamily